MTFLRHSCLLLIFSCVGVSFSGNASAQQVACDSVYTFAENPPEYPGGMKGFYDFVKGFKFDELGPEDPVVGKFTIHLTVDKTGKPADIQVTPESDPGLALREYLVKMQTWTPASTKDGQVCFKTKIPVYVHFK